MALLALCDDKRRPSIKKVSLTADAHEAVAAAFARQEETFRRGEEKPYDQNWQPRDEEDDEIFTVPIPSDVTVFGEIERTGDTSLPPLRKAEEIRSLAMRLDEPERILVQMFTPTQVLDTRSKGSVSLLLERDTYSQVREPVLVLGHRLVCIAEGGLLKFRSLHNLGRVIDTTGIFRAATDGEVRAFTQEYSTLFEFADVDGFVSSSNRNARKYMASITVNSTLQGKTATELHEKASETGLVLELTDEGDRIVMPTASREIAELMNFLNENRYSGPLTGTPYVTNSRRSAR